MQVIGINRKPLGKLQEAIGQLIPSSMKMHVGGGLDYCTLAFSITQRENLYLGIVLRRAPTPFLLESPYGNYRKLEENYMELAVISSEFLLNSLLLPS